MLATDGIAVRVVSLPSWELFDAQPVSYRDSVLPPAIKARVAVEAASPLGWERYVGFEGAMVSISHFGASAPGGIVYEKFGFTAGNVAQEARRLVQGGGE